MSVGYPLAPPLRYFEITAQECLGGSRAQAYDNLRAQDRNFTIQPGATGGNFEGIWFFVYTALASRFPFEVFDYVGGIDPAAVYACRSQRLVEHCPCRSYKRMSGVILSVAGLFTHQHNLRSLAAFAKYSLRSVLV